MNVHRFTSAFAPQLEAYLAFKQNMGCYGTSRAWYLHRFDTYCLEHGLTVCDRDTVEGWVLERLDRSGRYRSWMSYIRDFGRWLAAHGDTDAYVLSDRWNAPFVPAHPYLLTTEQIELFFAAAAHLQASSPWRWQATAFFTLMHSCGIRTGEARALLTEQVDLHKRHLDIISAKGNRSRRLPVTGQVIDVLSACQRASAAQFPSRRTFFVSATGNQVGAARSARCSTASGTRPGYPRRHTGSEPARTTFATTSPTPTSNGGWPRAGTSPMLPYLTRYMGHATFESTFYYVHTSPDFMHAYADITAAGASLLPQVGFE